ncbi:MAG: hypothetical protein IIC64_05230 [SAR324 cluster bacterium]|nr:hypothetical protein [SAR324 cluster bacterium]
MNKAFLFPLVVVGLLLAFPLIEMDARDYILLILFTLFLNIVLAQSYDIVGGQMGYVNLGHIVFFAIGAYAFGIFLNAQLGFVLSLIGGAGASVAFAALISYPFFRLRGAYFSLAAFGLVKLMEYEGEGADEPVNLGSVDELSMNDIVGCIGEIVGRKLDVTRHPLPQNDPVRRRPDTTRAKQRLDWAPRVSLSDGLRKTVDYFRSISVQAAK